MENWFYDKNAIDVGFDYVSDLFCIEDLLDEL